MLANYLPNSYLFRRALFHYKIIFSWQIEFPKLINFNRRCLWLVDEQEAHILSALKDDNVPGNRHKIGCFLGSEAANYKTNLTLKDRIKKSYYGFIDCA
jgi:hypothetical protein